VGTGLSESDRNAVLATAGCKRSAIPAAAVALPPESPPASVGHPYHLQQTIKVKLELGGQFQVPSATPASARIQREV